MSLIKIIRSPNRPQLTEGESFLAEYFDESGLKYVPQKIIPNLKYDVKSYREADFYLKNYGIYVEFYGGWNNSKDERARYREKKNVYFKNRIPCVFIYPENLGTIEFTFPKRAIDVMKSHKMTSALLRLRTKYVWENKKENILAFLFVLWLYIFGKFTWEEDFYIQLIFVCTILYQPYAIWKYLRKDLGVS